MIIDQLQPYLTAITALFSIPTLGFILSIAKSIRDNAQDRIAVQDERLKRADEDIKRTEKWADREKAALKEELNKKQAEMDILLKNEGIDLTNLTLGKQLSDSTSAVREAAHALIEEIREKIDQLKKVEKSKNEYRNPNWELSLAMGEMAFGSYDKAAAYFDAYHRVDSQSWEANFTRGVAHANARGGTESNLASLRAYNEAIAFAPGDLDVDRRARLFGYRGAILKRLNRLDEAEADLKIASSIAKSNYMISDVQYNLACVYAMRGQKNEMMCELNKLSRNKRLLKDVLAHQSDYFKKFLGDPDFEAICRK